MPLLDPAMGHLLRRAGFGASVDEAPIWNAMSVTAAIDALVDYEQTPDDVDSHIGVPGYLGTVSEGPFTPHLNLGDAIQRWIFRMVHSQRPLQEKMALFWHNYFATSYGKIAGQLGGEGAVRALAAKPAEDPDGLQGQLELFRERALGNFRDLLLAVAQDPAMVAWLDGDSNFRGSPRRILRASSWSCSRSGSASLPRRTSTRVPGCSPGGTWRERSEVTTRRRRPFTTTGWSTTPERRRSASQSTPMATGRYLRATQARARKTGSI